MLLCRKFKGGHGPGAAPLATPLLYVVAFHLSTAGAPSAKFRHCSPNINPINSLTQCDEQHALICFAINVRSADN